MGIRRSVNGQSRAATMERIGDSGVREKGDWAGFMGDEFLQAMRGSEKYKNLNEMRLNSPIVTSALMAIKYPIRNVGWFYTSDEGEDDPRLELLNEAKDNMRTTWEQHLMEALTMLDFGFAPCAIQYRREGGRILWDRFMLLGQDTVMKWDWAEDGELQGLQQLPHIWPAPIPIERIVLYRVNVERNNPEGRSMLRGSWTPYYYVRELQKIEAIGKERGMAGIPVITMPYGSDPSESGDDYTKANKLVRRIRMDEQAGVVLPTPTQDNPWKLELLATGVNSELAMNTTIQRHEARILMSMLTQFLMLGFTQVGTQAKAETDMDLFNMAIDSVADIIADSHTRQAIPRLLALNGMDAKGIRMEHSPPGDFDLSEYADFLQKAGDKLTWTPADEMELRERARMPKLTAEEIAELQEEERERKAAMLPQLPPRPMPEQEFAAAPGAGVAGNAPDDDERRKLERAWAREGARYFTNAEKRVMRGARLVR